MFEHEHGKTYRGEAMKFQSLSGLTLCLNLLDIAKKDKVESHVSIPFRADTVFEPKISWLRKAND